MDMRAEEGNRNSFKEYHQLEAKQSERKRKAKRPMRSEKEMRILRSMEQVQNI